MYRIAVVGIIFTALLSTYSHPFALRHHLFLRNCTTLALFLHYQYFSIANHLSEPMIVGNFILLPCLLMIPVSKNWQWFLSISLFVITLFTCGIADASDTDKLFLLAGTATVDIVLSIVQFDRISGITSLASVRSEQRLTLNSLREGVVFVDMNGNLKSWNEPANQILEITTKAGAHRLQFPNLLLPASISSQLENKFEDPILYSLQTKENFNDFTFGFTDSRSATKWLSLDTKLVENTESNSLIGLVATFRDITEQIATKKKLEENQAQLLNSSKLASLGEMSGGIAHEINNPLAIIHTFIQKLKRYINQPTLDQAKAQDALRIIEQTVERIAKIVKGLKNLSRQDANDKMEAVSAKEMIEETLSFCQESFKLRGITLKTQLPEDDILVECHRAQISQIILNLCQNARDAVENELIKTIEVKVANVQNRLQISVSDSGPGIPDHIRHKIMNPFFTTKAAGKGTGLGLSISKALAENHGGRLYLDDTLPDTCFILELPIKHQIQNKEDAA